MNPEVKKMWIEALRSGEYKQTIKGLHNHKENGFCCLGVLCDISKLGEWEKIDNYYSKYKSLEYEDFHATVLPDFLLEWAGLTTNNPVPSAIKWSDTLATINDSDATFDTLAAINDSGATFEEIADIIEKEL